MIPYSLALIGGGLVCAALFLVIADSALAFSIAFVFGYMFLPEAKALTILPGLPDLDKFAMVSLACLIGTGFRLNTLANFRFRWADLLLVGFILVIFAASMNNGFGIYDGASNAFRTTLEFLLPMLLARIHLNTPRAMNIFLMTLAVGATLYAPLVLFEVRMSPQFHNIAYGYFQHDWVQFQPRMGGFYRPVVFFTHALNLGRFLAFVTFVAAFAVRNKLGRTLPMGQYYFLACGAAWMVTFSYGPWMLLLLLTASYLVWRPKFWWAYLVIPAGAFTWMTLVFLGQQPGWGAVDVIADFNTARAESLQYRLDALDEYRERILENPIVGHAGWGQGRIQNRATDSACLILALKYGLLGAGLYYLWWFYVTYVALRLAKDTHFTSFGPVARCAALILPFAVAVCMVDTALEYHIYVLAGSILAVSSQFHETAPSRVRSRRPSPAAMTQTGQTRTGPAPRRPKMASF